MKIVKCMICILTCICLLISLGVTVYAAESDVNFKYDQIYFSSVINNMVIVKKPFYTYHGTVTTSSGLGESKYIRVGGVKYSMVYRDIATSPYVNATYYYNDITIDLPVAIPASKKVDFDLMLLCTTNSSLVLTPMSAFNVEVKAYFSDGSNVLLISGVDYFLSDVVSSRLYSISDDTEIGNNYPSRRIEFNYVPSQDLEYIEITLLNSSTSLPETYATTDVTVAWLYEFGSSGVEDSDSSANEEVLNSITEIGDKITELNENILSMKDSIDNLSTPTDANQGQVNDLNDKKDSLQQEMDSYTSVIDSIEKPPASSILPDSSELLGGNSSSTESNSTGFQVATGGRSEDGTFAYSGDFASVMFSSLYEVEYFAWMLVVVASMALVSYILFGKIHG